jgi:hypothetical protein
MRILTKKHHFISSKLMSKERAIAFERRKINVKITSTPTTVADNCIAQLMYYLNCVKQVVSFNIPSQFTDYEHWSAVASSDFLAVMILARKLSPSILLSAHVFVLDEDNSVCKNSNNKFVEIKDESMSAFVNSNMIIAGERVRVTNIMFCRPIWLTNNYFEPFRTLEKELSSERVSNARVCYRPVSVACSIQ